MSIPRPQGSEKTVSLTLGELPATDKQASADQPAPDKSNALKDFGLTVTTADDGKGLVVAFLGHSPRGDYVIFVTTTVKEYKKAQPQFVRWAASIKVF